MSRRPSRKDLVKNLPKRALFWVAVFILALLGDEYIKEGYLFNVDDMCTYGTHEFLITLLAALGVAIAICNKVVGKK